MREKKIDLRPAETVDYLRKSQSDDPLMTTEEVLARHESILDSWTERNLGGKTPEENKFREIVSGETISERPQMKRLLRLIESPEIKAVKVVDPQRLTRGDLEDIGRLMKLLKLTATLVITPERIYDLSDEYDWDALERELKRGNDYLNYYKKIQRRGKLSSVSAGNYIGSRAPYGYTKTTVSVGGRHCPTLTPNENAAVVRMIFEQYAEKNMQIGEICKMLDSLGVKPPAGEKWAKSAVRDMLGNVHYIGKISWNRRRHVTTVEDSELVTRRPIARGEDVLIFDGRHEAIITEEMFKAAAEKRERAPKRAQSTEIVNPLAGIMYCKCGSPMKLSAQHGSSEARYSCRHSSGMACSEASCSASELLSHISAALTAALDDEPLEIERAAKAKSAEHEGIVSLLEARLAGIKEREEKQWHAYLSDDPLLKMPDELFRRLNERTLKEKNEIEAALEKARIAEAEIESSAAPREMRLHSALSAISDSTIPAAERNRLLLACVDRVIYSRKREHGGSPRGNRYEKLTSPIELELHLRV